MMNFMFTFNVFVTTVKTTLHFYRTRLPTFHVKKPHFRSFICIGVYKIKRRNPRDV